jgi:hypothetical protein
MNETLSDLEIDLLGDLASDNHGLWEVFEFARLHNKSASPSEIFQIGKGLLEKWGSRGWLEFVSESGAPLNVGNAGEYVATLDPSAMEPKANSPWIKPTDVAVRYYKSLPRTA